MPEGVKAVLKQQATEARRARGQRSLSLEAAIQSRLFSLTGQRVDALRISKRRRGGGLKVSRERCSTKLKDGQQRR